MNGSCDWCGNAHRPTPGRMDNSVSVVMLDVPIKENVITCARITFHDGEWNQQTVCDDCFDKTIKHLVESRHFFQSSRPTEPRLLLTVFQVQHIL